MSEPTFEIVFRGKILKDFDRATVRRNLAQLFRTEEARVEAMLDQAKVVLKRGLGKEAAQRFQEALRTAGIMVAAMPEAVAAAPTAAANPPAPVVAVTAPTARPPAPAPTPLPPSPTAPAAAAATGGITLAPVEQEPVEKAPSTLSKLLFSE